MGQPVEKLTLLFKAESIIQRDALVALLMDHEIQVLTSPRDVSRKIADGTVDLSLGAASTFFDGFPVFVPDVQKGQALKVLNEFKQFTLHEAELDPTQHFRKFMYCAIFSITVPLVMHALGAFHLRKSIKAKEQIPSLKFTVCLSIYFLTLIAGTLMLVKAIN